MKPVQLTLEQYRYLLDQQLNKTRQYKDIAAEWGVPSSTVRTALHRGIKRYDIIIAEEHYNERHGSRDTRSVGTGLAT
jgi:DNA-directed RNA polymerase specialized sigma24 family protein